MICKHRVSFEQDFSVLVRKKDRGGHKTDVYSICNRKFDIYKLDLTKYKVKLYATKKLSLEIIPHTI